MVLVVSRVLANLALGNNFGGELGIATMLFAQAAIIDDLEYT